MDCWMEIQDGKGPWASPVTGIVPLGSTLTMVVAINDPNGETDVPGCRDMRAGPGMRRRVSRGVRLAHREKPSRLIEKDYVCFGAQEVVS